MQLGTIMYIFTNMETRDNATEKIKAKLDEIFWQNTRTLHQMHQLF